MGNRQAKHIHKYYRATNGFTTLWACALPTCTHYMPKHLEHMMNGKASICWECGQNMILHPGNMDMTQPTCDKCKLGVQSEDELPMTDAMRNFVSAKGK